MSEQPPQTPSPEEAIVLTPSKDCQKLSVSLVKCQASSLLSEAAGFEGTPAAGGGGGTTSSSSSNSGVILRLSWKLRVHGYLAKFVAASGAVGFALEALGGFLAPVGPGRDRLATALRDSHTAEWVGFVCVFAGLVNVWVKNGRVSLLVAYGANVAAMLFAGVGVCVSCLLLALYFRLRDAAATQDLLNASLLALFVLLAQLAGLLALLAHTLAYHPYRIFALANRLRADSAATSDTAAAPD